MDDRLGREMAEGPAAVGGTLANVTAVQAAFDRLAASAERIVLVGTGGSLAVSRAAAPSWRRRLVAADGPPLIVRQSADLVLGDLDGDGLGRGELVIAISQSGTSPETLAATALARGAGAPVVSVTAQRSSPLATGASLLVEVASGEETDASTKSALATLAGLLGLAGVIDAGPAGADRIVETLDAVVASRSLADDVGPRLAGARRTWCVGFGSALGIAEAGALLWHEKVIRQAVAATPAEFRHGLVEAAGRGDAVILIEVDDPDPRRLAYLARLRDELASLEVDLVEIGSGPNAPGRPGVEVTPPKLALTGADPGTRILEALLRVQQLGRATALAAGTYRDGFRILRETVRPADEILGPGTWT